MAPPARVERAGDVGGRKVGKGRGQEHHGATEESGDVRWEHKLPAICRRRAVGIDGSRGRDAHMTEVKEAARERCHGT